MDIVFNFLADNYIIFAIASGVLFLALIGIIFAGKKKDSKKNDDPTLQPLSMSGELVLDPSSQLIDDSEIVNNKSSEMESVTPVIIANDQNVIEPSLVGLESTASEVKVGDGIVGEPDSLSPSLVIEDTTAAPETPSLVIDDKTTAPETPSLVIEDTTAAPETPSLVIDDATAAPETPSLVIDDATAAPETPSLVIEDKTTAPETPSLVIDDKTQTPGI